MVEEFTRTFEVINTVQSGLILVVNLSLFILLVSRRSLRVRASNQLFGHLQLIHMTIGLLRVVSSYKISTDISSNVLLISMFASLLLTSGDRLFALKCPLKYKLVTGKMVVRLIIASWIPSLMFTVVAHVSDVGGGEMRIIHTVLIAIAATVLAVCNVIIYVVVRDHQKFVRKNSYVPPKKGRFAMKGSRRKRTSSLKASYICLAIVLNFIVFWLPHCVHDIIELTSELLISPNLDVLDIVVKQLTLLNSFTDPIVCLSTKTQMEIKKIFKFLAQQKDHVKESSRSDYSETRLK